MPCIAEKIWNTEGGAAPGTTSHGQQLRHGARLGYQLGGWRMVHVENMAFISIYGDISIIYKWGKYGEITNEWRFNGIDRDIMGYFIGNMVIFVGTGGAIFSERAKWHEELMLGVDGISTATEATYSPLDPSNSEQGSFYFPLGLKSFLGGEIVVYPPFTNVVKG